VLVNPESPTRLESFYGYEVETGVAGLDAQGRPSFLTGERFDSSGTYGRTVTRETRESECIIARGDLEQSAFYTSDLTQECYIAQWSFVGYVKRPLVERVLRSSDESLLGRLFAGHGALYERACTYHIDVYLALGKYHLCLGYSFSLQNA
jgi:hypothetical protein